MSWSVPALQLVSAVTISVDHGTPITSTLLEGQMKITDLSPGMHLVVVAPASDSGITFNAAFVTLQTLAAVSGKGEGKVGIALHGWSLVGYAYVGILK